MSGHNLCGSWQTTMRYRLRFSPASRAAPRVTWIGVAAVVLFSLAGPVAAQEPSEGHRWYSELAQGLTDAGWTLVVDIPPNRRATQGVLFLATFARERLKYPPKYAAILTMDYCMEHGEVRVTDYKPPKAGVVSINAGWPGTGGDHRWYSDLAPDLTGAGLRLAIPAFATEAVWGGVVTENLALKNPKLVAFRSRMAHFTIDICWVHGEVKVLAFKPPRAQSNE